MSILVSLAILHVEDKFLMQLRDDVPGIVYSGHWGLFGGHIEENETPEEAVTRELFEEIGYKKIEHLKLFRVYQGVDVVRYVFSAPLLIQLEDIVLGEGWDYALVSKEVITTQAQYYSPIAGGMYPFIPMVREIILDFLAEDL